MGRTILLLLALLVLAAPALADDAAEKLIKRGDKYYGNRAKGVKWVEKAIEYYEKALAVDTKSVQASWKLALASYWLGGRKETSAEKLKTYQKGIDAAKRAIKLDDKSVESHYWLGVCYGKFGEAKGIMNSLGLVPHIKKEMNRVLELDESYGYGGAYVVLGRMYFKLPGVAGGSNEKSVENLKKALKLENGHLLSHLFLAETYESMGKKADAIKELETLLKLPDQKGREPENADERKRAKALLEKLQPKDKKEEDK